MLRTHHRTKNVVIYGVLFRSLVAISSKVLHFIDRGFRCMTISRLGVLGEEVKCVLRSIICLIQFRMLLGASIRLVLKAYRLSLGEVIGRALLRIQNFTAACRLDRLGVDVHEHLGLGVR